jgi:hypothetical protein
LLEAIGAISKHEAKSAERGNFQEDVTLPMSQESDNNAVVQGDVNDPESSDDHPNEINILSAITKVL